MDLHTRIPLARSGNQSLKEANVNFGCYNFAMRRMRKETITSNASFETRNYRSNCSTITVCSVEDRPPVKRHYIKCHFEGATLSLSVVSPPYKWV